MVVLVETAHFNAEIVPVDGEEQLGDLFHV